MFFASLLHQSPHGVCCLIGLECLNNPSWFLDWTFSQPTHNLKNLRVGWKHLFSLLRLKCCNACFRERHEMERSSFTLFDLGIFVEPLESTAKGWRWLELRGQGFSWVFRVCGVAVWCHDVSCRIPCVLHRNYARFWSGQRVHPDVVTFNTAISACAKGGSWLKSVELFCDLDSDHELRIVQTCFFSALLCSAFQRGSNVQLQACSLSRKWRLTALRSIQLLGQHQFI